MRPEAIRVMLTGASRVQPLHLQSAATSTRDCGHDTFVLGFAMDTCVYLEESSKRLFVFCGMFRELLSVTQPYAGIRQPFPYRRSPCLS